MTEIEFLVEMLSNEEMSESLQAKLLARIGDIERNRGLVGTVPYVPFPPYPATPHIIFNPSLPLCQHEYPFPWHGTVPPSCKKCGCQAQYPYYTITSTSANVDLEKVQTGLLGDLPSTTLKLF